MLTHAALVVSLPVSSVFAQAPVTTNVTFSVSGIQTKTRDQVNENTVGSGPATLIPFGSGTGSFSVSGLISSNTYSGVLSFVLPSGDSLNLGFQNAGTIPVMALAARS
jgi:hypothetical protein